MNCWKCGKDTGEKEGIKLSFRAECPSCGADLHTCRQCKYYKPGLPNDCMVPGTDYVADREKMNYCEEFKGCSPSSRSSGPAREDIEKRLFGD